MYFLRYPAGTALELAQHGPTLGRFGTWLEAEEARCQRPKPWRDLLEVVGPRWAA